MAKPPVHKPRSSKSPTQQPKPVPPAKTGKGKKGPSRFGAIVEAAGHKLFLTLIASAVIATAVGAGAFLTYEIRADVWETKYQNENRQQIIQMRIQLLERTIQMMSKSLAVSQSGKTNKKSSLKTLARLGLDPGSIVDVISKTLDKQTLAKCRYLESHSEYATLLRLDAIFFGDSTRQVIDGMMNLKPWWGVSSSRRASLVRALEYDFLHGNGPL